MTGREEHSPADRPEPTSAREKAKVIAELLRAPAAFCAIGDPLVGRTPAAPSKPADCSCPSPRS